MTSGQAGGGIVTAMNAVVVGGARGAGREIALGLTDRGGRVAVIDRVYVAGGMQSAFEAAEQEVGPLDLVVWAQLPDGNACDLADLDLAAWTDLAERPLHELLGCLQA